MKREVFFRIKMLVDGEWMQSKATYKSHKEAKLAAEDAMLSPNEYKIIRCERKVI